MNHPCSPDDAFRILGGDFAEDLSELLNGNIAEFVFSSRRRRHVLLCLLDASPGALRSAFVRFGPDAPCDQLIEWCLDRRTPLLKPVLKRLPAVALSRRGQYVGLRTKLLDRSRTGIVLCRFGSLSQSIIEIVLELPDTLIEPKLISLVRDARRAKAVSQLFAMAVEDGHDPANLGAALRSADDMHGIERLLERALGSDRLPSAPCPDHPGLVPVTSASDLRKLGARFRNCLQHGIHFRRGAGEGESFFRWAGEEEAIVAVHRDSRGYRLSEVKLAGNEEPSSQTMSEIIAAFQGIGILSRPDPADLLMAL